MEVAAGTGTGPNHPLKDSSGRCGVSRWRRPDTGKKSASSSHRPVSRCRRRVRSTLLPLAGWTSTLPPPPRWPARPPGLARAGVSTPSRFHAKSSFGAKLHRIAATATSPFRIRLQDLYNLQLLLSSSALPRSGTPVAQVWIRRRRPRAGTWNDRTSPDASTRRQRQLWRRRRPDPIRSPSNP